MKIKYWHCVNKIKEETLKPINEEILKGYLDWNNSEFLKDNISRGTQTEFRTWDRCIFT